MPRTSKTDTNKGIPKVETQPADTDIAHTIAERYYGCIEEVAPQIAREFWNRLDRAIAAEILKQRPGANQSQAPPFLAGIGDRLAKLEYSDATPRAIASGGGMG